MDNLQQYYNNMNIAELNLMYVTSLQTAFETSGITFKINDGKITAIEGGNDNE